MPKIIIVEDDPMILEIYQKKFADAGFEVFPVETAEQALHVAKREKVDAVMTDLIMPKMDGFAVLEKVKADPQLRLIPVLMLTSTDDQVEINRCYALGANSYVIKPISYDAFQERVKALGLFLDIVRFPE